MMKLTATSHLQTMCQILVGERNANLGTASTDKQMLDFASTLFARESLGVSLENSAVSTLDERSIRSIFSSKHPRCCHLLC